MKITVGDTADQTLYAIDVPAPEDWTEAIDERGSLIENRHVLGLEGTD